MVGYNVNRGNSNLRLFEAGEVFEKLGDRHEERRHLGFAATGEALAKTVHSGPQPYTFFHMKGDVEELLAAFSTALCLSTVRRRRTCTPAGRRVQSWTARPSHTSGNCTRNGGCKKVPPGRVCGGSAARPADTGTNRSSPATSASLSFLPSSATSPLSSMTRSPSTGSSRLSKSWESQSYRGSCPPRSTVAKKLVPAKYRPCSTPSSSRRNAPYATTRWRSGHRKSSRPWRSSAALCAPDTSPQRHRGTEKLKIKAAAKIRGCFWGVS